jgi:hypothetical protein
MTKIKIFKQNMEKMSKIYRKMIILLEIWMNGRENSQNNLKKKNQLNKKYMISQNPFGKRMINYTVMNP